MFLLLGSSSDFVLVCRGVVSLPSERKVLLSHEFCVNALIVPSANFTAQTARLQKMPHLYYQVWLEELRQL